MNTQEHLLTVVMEECVELAQRCSKALRFGMGEKQPEQRYTNAERIKEEYTDLVAVVSMLSATVGFELDSVDVDKLLAKKSKVRKYLAYSFKQGTLDEMTVGGDGEIEP